MFGLKTGMPSIKVVPSGDSSRTGYNQVQQAFGKGAPGAVQIVTAQGDAARVTVVAKADPGIAQVMPAIPGAGGKALVQVVPNTDPSSKATGATDRPAALDAAAPARSSAAPSRRTTTSSSCCRPRRRSSSASC